MCRYPIIASATMTRDCRYAYVPLQPYWSDTKMFRRSATLLAVLVLGTATLGLTACNTVAGAGQDISKGGNKLTNSADKAAE